MFQRYARRIIIAIAAFWVASPVFAGEILTVAAPEAGGDSSTTFLPTFAFDIETVNPHYLPQWVSNSSYATWDRLNLLSGLNDDISVVQGQMAVAGLRLGIATQDFRVSAFGGFSFQASSNSLGTQLTSPLPAWTLGAKFDIALTQNWVGQAEYYYIGQTNCLCFNSLTATHSSENVGLIGLKYSFSVDDKPKPPQGPFPTDPRPWK